LIKAGLDHIEDPPEPVCALHGKILPDAARPGLIVLAVFS